MKGDDITLVRPVFVLGCNLAGRHNVEDRLGSNGIVQVDRALADDIPVAALQFR